MCVPRLYVTRCVFRVCLCAARFARETNGTWYRSECVENAIDSLGTTRRPLLHVVFVARTEEAVAGSPLLASPTLLPPSSLREILFILP